MKSPKIEGGESTSPSQAAAAVSSASKSNFKTPKSEMLDDPLLPDTTLTLKIPNSETLPDNPFLLSDTKIRLNIKTPKSEISDDTDTPFLFSDAKLSLNIKIPKSEMLSDNCVLLPDTKLSLNIKTLESEMVKTEVVEFAEEEEEEDGSTSEDEEDGINDDGAVVNLLDDEEEWVTVYGFTYKDTKFVLQKFETCGVILDYVCQGNWMHILYQNRREAQKALSKSGKKINDNLIVGLNPMDQNQKQALNARKPLLPFDRARKALCEDIRLLHRSEGNFFVLAATGNVYTVTLSTTPICRCNCPDSEVPCKHILFVFLRVLGIPRNDFRLCRKRLKPSQLTDLLKMPTSAQTLASAYTRDKFRHLFTAAKVKVGLPPSIQNDGECAICDGEMDRYDIVKCGSCGDVGHKKCLVTYRKSSGIAVRKCKSCRTHWVAAIQNWYTKIPH